jgi:choline-sulfatase
LISLLTLIPLAAVCGIGTSFLFRTLAAKESRNTVDRIVAHVIELRLFLDEPALILRAQRDLLRENARLLRQIALPVLLAGSLFAGLAWKLDGVYGRAPLPAGKAAVVTAHSGAADLQIDAPEGVTVETPGVRVPAANEVSWRIRPVRAFSSPLVARTPDGTDTRVDVPWPRARIGGVDWLVWFFGIQTITAAMASLVRIPKRAAALMAAAMFASDAKAAEKPPIILISVDTLRADHLNSYGYSKIRTPNIDSFSEHGTIYRQIDSQIPLTLPSHTVLMTSEWPFITEVESNTQSVPPRTVTLASVLRANGYATAAFIGSMILDRRYGLDQGFDFYDSPFEAAAGSTPNPYSARVRRDAALVLRAARQWMARNVGKPCFVFIHLFDLHTPYPLPGIAGLKPNLAGYDAQLQRIDGALGGFHDQLVRDGWWDKSLVVLLSDHGEGLGDHGETSHGYFIYESTIHVPLIVHWPSDAPPHPASDDSPGGLVDVAPTILDYAGIPAPASFSGVSLLRPAETRTVFSESVYPRDTFGWAALRSLREGTYKFIDAPRAEFYDLRRDTGETSNTLQTHEKDAAPMKQRLSSLLAREPAPRAEGAPELSPHMREALQSLGYTAGAKAGGTSGADPKDRIAEHEAYENGLALLYTRDYGGAIRELNSVTARDPQNLPALCALGEAHFRSGNAPRALRLWQQALDRNPKYRPAAESIGEYWLSRRDYAKACPLIPLAPECLSQRGNK